MRDPVLDEMSDSLGDAPKAVKDSYFELYRTVAELNGRLNALKMGLLKETDHREEEDQTNPFHAKEFICDACGQPLIGKISEAIDAAGVQIGG
jgi:hypothetical protein